MSLFDDMFGDDFDEFRQLGDEFRHIMRDARDEFRDILHDARDDIRNAVDEVVSPDSDGGQLIHEIRKMSDRNEEMFNNAGDAYMNLFYDEHYAEEKARFDLADHLFVRVLDLYTHHAIYVGNSQVIHYSNDPTGTPVICRASLSAFAEGRKIHCMREWESPLKYTRQEAVRRAEGRLNENRYSLIGNNCEQFVRWCRSGGEEWVWE